MKKLVTIFFALTMMIALVACGKQDTNPAGNPSQDQSDLNYVKENGKMIIGYTDYAPMNYTDESGTFTGFDTELASLICEKLDIEPEFVEINWDTKEVELKARSIDCIWNGLTINEERKAEMEITQPYIKNAQVIVMKEDAAYEDTASLIGKSISAEQGSAGETAIEDDEHLKEASYVPKTLQTEALMEVKAGTADAAILDLTLAKTMTGEGTNYEEVIIVDHLAEENYGAAFRKGSDIAEEVNKIFDQLIEEGTLSTLADKYGLELAK